jgi:hypothetical protein
MKLHVHHKSISEKGKKKREYLFMPWFRGASLNMHWPRTEDRVPKSSIKQKWREVFAVCHRHSCSTKCLSIFGRNSTRAGLKPQRARICWLIDGQDVDVLPEAGIHLLRKADVNLISCFWISWNFVIAITISVNFFLLIKFIEMHTFREETWWFKRGFSEWKFVTWREPDLTQCHVSINHSNLKALRWHDNLT